MTRPAETSRDAAPALLDLLEACPTAGALLVGGGTVAQWNPAAERLLGHARSEVIGRPLEEMVSMPPQLAAQIRDWSRLGQRERSELASGIRLLADRADRTAVPLNLSIVETPDGAVVAWLQTQAEAPAPPLDADVFRIIFERAPEAITILDADLRQRSVNPAGLDLVGLPPGLEDVGQGALYIHPDDQRILVERARRRHAGLPVPDEPVRYRVSHADGTWRWLESLSVDLRDVPAVNGFVVLSRDVTVAEEQRIALETATERLNELDRARNHLISAVSHELRTPLAAILSASEHLATDPVDTDELRSYAQLIHRNAERLDALVADLLLIGRLQNRTLPVELGPVDVPTVLGQVVAEVDQRDGPPVTLETTAGPPARADAGRLLQVVENLLGNALKFGGSGGVFLSARPDGGQWRITVIDHGPGIDPTVLDRVYDPFFRAPATERAAGGTGLGLAIARGIVDLHGGTLYLGPAEGGGTEAVVSIPMWVDETGSDAR